MVESLAGLLQPWADLYAASTPVQAVVVFLHLAALVVAGGLAIATDRAIVRATPAAAAVRAHVIQDVTSAHRLVIVGLVLLVITGGLMLLADVAALLPSWLFWVKMGFFALLLVNGILLQRAERHEQLAEDPVAWRRLRAAAVRSTSLWLVLLLIGTLLPMLV